MVTVSLVHFMRNLGALSVGLEAEEVVQRVRWTVRVSVAYRTSFILAIATSWV